LIVVVAYFPLPGVLHAIFRDYAACVDEPFSSEGRGHYLYIKKHLESPFRGYSVAQILAPQFGVVTLSHMACGLVNVSRAEPELKSEIAPLLAEVVRRALSDQISPYDRSPAEVEDWGGHGLYLSHLNLILGCHRHVTGNADYDALHRRLTEHLSSASLKDGDFHITSYPESPKWPADQTVTLCSLHLFDRIHGTTFSSQPIEGWLDFMKQQATAVELNLPHSSISPLNYSAQPRGCAISWSILYMAQFAPAEAASVYASYRAAYFKTVLGCGGFREWQPGVSLGMDVDSGPIVFEIGVAATGLGLGATRFFKDREAYVAIMRSAATVGMPNALGARRHYHLSPLLGEAILFHGQTATTWFEPLPSTDYPVSRSFPTGAILMLLFWLLVMAFFAHRSWKLLGKIRQAPPTRREPHPTTDHGAGIRA
jgi:hypothetical protein